MNTPAMTLPQTLRGNYEGSHKHIVNGSLRRGKEYQSVLDEQATKRLPTFIPELKGLPTCQNKYNEVKKYRVKLVGAKNVVPYA